MKSLGPQKYPALAGMCGSDRERKPCSPAGKFGLLKIGTLIGLCRANEAIVKMGSTKGLFLNTPKRAFGELRLGFEGATHPVKVATLRPPHRV